MSTFYKHPHRRSSRHRHDHQRRVLSHSRKIAGLVALLCAPFTVASFAAYLWAQAANRKTVWLWIGIGYATLNLAGLIAFVAFGALRHRHDRHPPADRPSA